MSLLKFSTLTVLIFAFICTGVRASAIGPNDILLTTSRFYNPTNEVIEYTQAGAMVQNWIVPFPGLDPTAGNPRGVTVGPDGNTIYVYDGTNPAFITTINATTGATGQQQATTLGTSNTVYDGNVAASGGYLFAGPANGLVRFNTSDFSFQQYLAGKSVEKLSIGADGNLYVLNGSESSGWPGVEVYNPTTMNLVRSIAFVGSGSSGVTGDAAGNIFNISGNTVYEYSPADVLLRSLTTTVSLEDIQIAANGQILLGGYGAWILTDESLTLASAHYFPTPGSGPVFVSFAQPAGVPEPGVGGLIIVVVGCGAIMRRRHRLIVQ